LVDEYPVFHVTAITHRRHPVYAATIVGRPPMEDCYLAKATERIFLPLLNAVLPEVRDYWLPWEGVFHNITVLSIAKEYPGHARRIMSALWGQGQMSFCKALVVMDRDVDLKDPGQVFATLLNTVDLESDVYISEGVLDVLDHSAPAPLFGAKVGIDATRRMSGERERESATATTVEPDPATVNSALQAISHLISGFHVPVLNTRHRLLLVNLRKDGTVSGRELAKPLLTHPELAAYSIVVLYDHHIDLRDGSLVLWKVFNNVDPKRDMIRLQGRMLIDATKKGIEDGHDRPWPDDIVMDPVVVEQVMRRAGELGIASLLRP
jgi:4-hydroxy-3-polyprenylbenzoate decarboxylase